MGPGGCNHRTARGSLAEVGRVGREMGKLDGTFVRL